MAASQVPLLVISGSMGTGKTTVLYEASDLLSEAGVAHAALDLDCLSVMHPQRGPRGQRLEFTNLAAVWPNYVASGAERLSSLQRSRTVRISTNTEQPCRAPSPWCVG